MIATDSAGRILLVRNSYGAVDRLVLPGGGIRWRESPERAACRELLEETGCRALDCVPFGVCRATAEGKRDTVHVFACTTRDDPVADGREVLEAAFLPVDALPGHVSPATRCRIAEWRTGSRSADR